MNKLKQFCLWWLCFTAPATNHPAMWAMVCFITGCAGGFFVPTCWFCIPWGLAWGLRAGCLIGYADSEVREARDLTRILYPQSRNREEIEW